MNRHHFLAVLLAAASLAGVGSAQAADTVNINVTGRIVGSCGLQTSNALIDLGHVQASSIPNTGDASPWVEAALTSKGCYLPHVDMTFQGAVDATNPALFAATGGAQGVGIELRSYDDEKAVPNGTTPMGWATRKAGETYRFKARYVRTAVPIAAGPGKATITVTLAYN